MNDCKGPRVAPGATVVALGLCEEPGAKPSHAQPQTLSERDPGASVSAERLVNGSVLVVG